MEGLSSEQVSSIGNEGILTPQNPLSTQGTEEIGWGGGGDLASLPLGALIHETGSLLQEQFPEDST